MCGLCDLFYDEVPPPLGTRDEETGHVGVHTLLGRGAPSSGCGRDTGTQGARLFPRGQRDAGPSLAAAIFIIHEEVGLLRKPIFFASFAPGPREVSACELFTRGRISVLEGDAEGAFSVCRAN